MQTTTTISGKQIVVAIVATGLIIMAISSFFYRLQGLASLSSSQATSQTPAGQMTAEQAQSVQHYMEMLQKDPNDTDALSGLGGIFLNSGTWDKAASFWERYLKIKPDDEEAVYHYAIALLNMDRFKDAADQFEIVVRLNPKSYGGYYYVGMINIYYLDNKAKGKQYLEKVVELNPDNKEVVDTVRNELQQM